MNDVEDGQVSIVKPEPAKTLEQVVVSPTGVDVSIDCGRIRPAIVGVRGEVGRKQRPPAVQELLDRDKVSTEVECAQRRRTKFVRCDKETSQRCRADLLFTAEYAHPSSDVLALQVGAFFDDYPRTRVNEVPEQLEGWCGRPDHVNESWAARSYQHEQRGGHGAQFDSDVAADDPPGLLRR